jgi:hypothetical protein
MHKITCTTYFRGTNPSTQAEIAKLPVVSLKVTFLQDFYSSVSIAIGYRPDGWGLIPGRGKRFFSSPQYPEQFWVPPSILYSGY